MSNKTTKCDSHHSPDWLVIYDIGKKKTEQISVCQKCFDDPTDDCFRIFVISRTPQRGEFNSD